MFTNSMNLTFQSHDLLDSSVIDSRTGQPLFWIATSRGLFHGCLTTVSAARSFAYPSIIAEIDWSGWGSTKVSYVGQRMSLSRFLHRVSHVVRKSYWEFKGPNGKMYRWQVDHNTMKLRDSQSKKCIAQCRLGASQRLFTRGLGLDVYGEGIAMLDLVILTFILASEQHRHSSDTRTAQSARSSRNRRNRNIAVAAATASC